MKNTIKKLLIILNSMVLLLSLYSPILYAEETLHDEVTDDANNDITSIAMLNYLTVINQEIYSERKNKLYMEQVYKSLISNTYPNAIDDRTQRQLNRMLDTIEKYRMLDVKRERLQYIFEQNQAQALREAVPNPTAVLSTAVSMDWKKMIGTVVYMAVDSKASYDTSMASAEMEFLQDGWELDDEAANALHESRKDMFNYLNDIVRIHDIPGDLTLGEEQVDDFVKWKNETNIASRIDTLEDNKDDYRMFGGYWLLLAESYYDDNQYKKCIDAVDAYEALNVRIFRKDYDLSRVLPLAIYSVQNSNLPNNNKEEKIRHYVDVLTSNIKTSDWALRYFAAQTYMYLFTLSNKSSDLKTAYDLGIDNIKNLVPEQKKMNDTYLQPIKEIETPPGSTKSKKKELSEYNKLLKESRKKELAPISQPLLINLQLIEALSKRIKIGDTDKMKLEKILYGNSTNEVLFLNHELDNAFRMDSATGKHIYNIEYEKNTIRIPGDAVSTNATIIVSINRNGEETVIEDWKVDEVKRDKNIDVAKFIAIFKSNVAKNYKYQDGDIINVIIHFGEVEADLEEIVDPIIVSFKVKKEKTMYFFDKIVFEKVE